FGFALLVVVVPGAAMAADLPQQVQAPTAPAAYAPAVPDWIVTIGLEGRIVPAYPGAADSKLGWSALPLFSIRKQGTPPDFFGPRDSFSFNILNLGAFQFGPALQFINRRKVSDYTELTGLSDVDYAAQLGAFANFWPVSWLRLRGEVRQGIGGETGVTGDLFLDAVVPVGQWTLSAGPRMTLQSAAAVSPYFSITAAQANAANTLQPTLGKLTAYSAGGGLYSYGAGAQVQYAFNETWTAHAFVEYERLTDSVANSPLVTARGSADQFTYGLGATYSFVMHPLW
ncbi:MAG: MipA/OmpV family protein, partial [Xanthobacteraceae bacterium]